jgi:hypothetical protein
LEYIQHGLRYHANRMMNKGHVVYTYANNDRKLLSILRANHTVIAYSVTHELDEGRLKRFLDSNEPYQDDLLFFSSPRHPAFSRKLASADKLEPLYSLVEPINEYLTAMND